MKKLFLVLLMMTSFLGAYAVEEPAFKVEVKGKGQPLILIPGLGCSGAVWESTVAALAQKYECHVLTLPGFAGQPAIPFQDNYLQQVKDQIIRYVEAKDLQQVGLIGHSLGGFLSLRLAAEYPDRFGPLLVIDALPFLLAVQMPGITEEGAKPIAENMRRMQAQQQGAGAAAQQRAVLSSMVSRQQDLERILSWNQASDGKTVSQAMYELYTTDLREEIASIKSPVLVLGAWIAYKDYGVTQESTLNVFRRQYARLKNAAVRMSEKGKHFIMYDDPELYFASLQQVFPHQ